MTKKFQKNKEDFVCEKCGAEVKGTGYTNHCPKCLWSKHVDVNPGDRAAMCGGLMEPISAEVEKGEYILTHRCVVCGYTKRNKVQKEDDFDVVADIAKKASERILKQTG